MAATTRGYDHSRRHEVLLRLIDDADVVLLDFDGPVCDLFGRRSTAPVAEAIKAMALSHWGVLDQAVQNCRDSHRILPLLCDMADKQVPGSLSRRPLELAHSIVTRFELDAVKRAAPTPHAESLLKCLWDLEKPVAIVSNNAEGPVKQYLDRRKLGSYIDVVCGRDPAEPRLMKPDPHLLFRALEQLGGHAPHKALMVGDQCTDLLASKAAGAAFLGCPRDAHRAREMERLGADCVVDSLEPVIAAARELTSAPRLRV